MKKFSLLTIAAAFLPGLALCQEKADSTGLPGDHFNLRGALELFRTSANLSEFEKALNTASNEVNNLDLNGDNSIDYIKVTDKTAGQSHVIVLQVPVNVKENQDVAAILIEHTEEEEARLQIIGNEVLYGEEKIVEPYAEVADKEPRGPAEFNTPMHYVVVNVWSWPCVSYLYYPSYVVYMSPWGWDYYPVWWSPWHPYYWNDFYYMTNRYHWMHYHYVDYYYVYDAYDVYHQHRTTSATVKERYTVPLAAYERKPTGGRADGKPAPVLNKEPQRAVTRGNQEEKTVLPATRAPETRPSMPTQESRPEPVRRPEEPQPQQRLERTHPQQAPARQQPPVARPPQRSTSPAPQSRPQGGQPARRGGR